MSRPDNRRVRGGHNLDLLLDPTRVRDREPPQPIPQLACTAGVRQPPSPRIGERGIVAPPLNQQGAHSTNVRASRSNAIRSTLAALALIAFASTGCGSSSAEPGGYYTPDTLAAEIAEAVHDEDGSRLLNPSCVQRSTHVYICIGDYRPSKQAIRNNLPGVDTSIYTTSDWRTLLKQYSDRVTYEATVADDGTWISEPQ